MRVFWISLAMLLAFIFGSCKPLPSASGNSPILTPTHSQVQESATQMPSMNSAENPISPINTLDFSEITPLRAEVNPFVKLVEEDLAERLGINLDQIHFLKISEIDWQDITQGCTSNAGQKLTKGRPSGYRIWLEANGKNYAYHIGLDNTILLCQD